MKKNIQKYLVATFIFPSLLLLFSFRPGDGIKKQKLPVIQKEVKLENPFQSVKIHGDVSLILTNQPAGTVMMEGNEKDLNKIKFIIKNNELAIDAHRKNIFHQLTIYLSAASLQLMQVNGDGDISSAGAIIPDDLHIWLNGNINVKIYTKSKLSIDANDGYDLVWGAPIKHQMK